MEKKELTLNEYQEMAMETAIYPQVKKVLRDNNSVFTEERKEEIAKEVGDVLWYIATLSHDIGYKLGDIAKMNYDKLHSRQLRGKLHGSGDNR